jgi:hypothetical protein
MADDLLRDKHEALPLPAEVWVVCNQVQPGKLTVDFAADDRTAAQDHASECAGHEVGREFGPYRVARYVHESMLAAAVTNAPASAIKAELPTELFDGYAVFEELGKHRALQPHQVSAVLDAVVRLIRKNAAPQANAEPLIGSRPIGGNVSEEPAGAAPIDGVMLARAIYALRGEHYPGDASFSASPPSSEQDRNIFDTDRSPLEKAYAVAWGALLTIANRGDLDVHGMQKFAYEQWRKAVAFEESNPQSATQDKLPLEPTPAMIEAGAQRLVYWDDGCKWPDSWDALQVTAARNDAEHVWRSMWLEATRIDSEGDAK